MTTVDLVHKHIRHDVSNGKLYFVFDSDSLDITSDGGNIITEGSKVLDFGLVMKDSGQLPTPEGITKVITDLLELREQGKFEDFL